MNQEIEALIKQENILRFIKSQRLAWYGHVNRMEDNKNVKAIIKWNPTDRRSRGSACNEDYELEKNVEDKLAWKHNVEQAKTHPGS